MSRLEGLPVEVLLACLAPLLPRDWHALGLTCRLWAAWVREHESTLYRLVYHRRFGRDDAIPMIPVPAEGQPDYRAAYRGRVALPAVLLAQAPRPPPPELMVLPASAFTIAWMPSPYWSWVPSPAGAEEGAPPARDSWSERVARLHAVCWLDVHAHISGVPGGRAYHVGWRMRLTTRRTFLDPVRFRARVDGAPAGTSTMMEATFAQLWRRPMPGGGGWWCFWHPDVLHVPGEYGRVEAQIMEMEEGGWKRGLDLDAFLLDPLDPGDGGLPLFTGNDDPESDQPEQEGEVEPSPPLPLERMRECRIS